MVVRDAWNRARHKFLVFPLCQGAGRESLCETWVLRYFQVMKRNLTRIAGLKEKAMPTHSSTVAWKIPWMEEPGRLQSMGSRRVRHDSATSLSLSTFMHWRRKWQPTPVFLPGESQGRRSLVGCSPWGRTESDTTEATWQQQAAAVILFTNIFSNSVGCLFCQWFPLLHKIF